ncbi:MAG: hypothetical protein AMK71_10760 [Nitrospira bacterium SG8_35_4]|nr:MAG: hypothetical protein AMK71_10760 [Nitrospira bacterium SG8_35_4]
MSLNVEDPVAQESGTLTSMGFAVNLGKQVLLKDIVIIDAWVGPSYNFRTVEAEGEIDTGISDADGFGIRLGIAIGIAF